MVSATDAGRPTRVRPAIRIPAAAKMAQSAVTGCMALRRAKNWVRTGRPKLQPANAIKLIAALSAAPAVAVSPTASATWSMARPADDGASRHLFRPGQRGAVAIREQVRHFFPHRHQHDSVDRHRPEQVACVQVDAIGAAVDLRDPQEHQMDEFPVRFVPLVT